MSPVVPLNAFDHPVHVTAEMVDVQGRVSNHEIVRLFAETAARHSEALGWDLEAYRRLGAWWVVRRHEVDYLRPALAGDDLLCRTWPSAVSKAAAERRHVLVRAADEAVIATGRNVWALVDMKTGRPRRIPAEVIAAFDPAQWAPEA